MVGGFPLLASCDYWLGFEEGARAALVQAELQDKAADHHLGCLFYREWGRRDDRDALAALPGPKILVGEAGTRTIGSWSLSIKALAHEASSCGESAVADECRGDADEGDEYPDTAPGPCRAAGRCVSR
jgi:hypothetical protein